MLDLEIPNKNIHFIAGCDEVGRGPLAGPVVACSVGCEVSLLNKKLINSLKKLGVTDSKKLSAKRRATLLSDLGLELTRLKSSKKSTFTFEGAKFHYSISELDNHKIDEINILQASLLAMKKSFLKILPAKETGFLMIDGNKDIKHSLKRLSTRPIIKGDSKSVLIGLASVIAKEFRDHQMSLFDELYPGYGLAKHAGYPTKQHREAIKELGVTPIHRKTFGGVKEHVENTSRSSI